MEIIIAFILINLLSLVIIPFVNSKVKGIITIAVVLINAVLSSILSVKSLGGVNFEYILAGSYITGDIPLRIDGLSAWFILLINFTMLTGALYGFYYMKAYKEQKTNLSVHCIAYILVHSSLISICGIQNSIAFLFAWEIMTISSFLLIIFEYYKHDTIKAGINLLIQSHIGVIFLTLAFIWVTVKMNSYDFASITTFSQNNSLMTSIILFIFFFIGFGIKAGFVPFHTWLPYAHPAAPTHISGIMSGVIIKIGIYGILRMLLLIKTDYIVVGSIILTVSVISAIYGVMLAIIQHNLKRLLAYHSIENIGIIGIGIGLGTIGIGTNNIVLISLGFAGALLHTLNHSLFKSLLFYAAGNVYQATHTMDIEHLGGIIKRMPHTAILFLIASLAICGLPPFNGFVSEFLIYLGMFTGLKTAGFSFIFVLIFSISGLVLVGGLAMLCFTKAYGIVFLGSPRKMFNHKTDEAETGKLIPMYVIVVIILSIGIYPKFYFWALTEPINLFLNSQNSNTLFPNSQFSIIGLYSLLFILLSGLIFYIRQRLSANKSQMRVETWGCGYVAPNNNMQYTASSYIRSFRKLAEPLLLVYKKKNEIKGIFPEEIQHSTYPYDKLEKWVIDKPLKQLKHFFNRFAFLQNGNLQFYIVYGVVFLILIIITPLIYEKIKMLFTFTNQF